MCEEGWEPAAIRGFSPVYPSHKQSNNESLFLNRKVSKDVWKKKGSRL